MSIELSKRNITMIALGIIFLLLSIVVTGSLSSVSITSPSAGSTVSGDTTITATVADHATQVTFYYQASGGTGWSPIGDPVVNDTYPDTDFSTTWSTSGVSDGTYTLNATAYNGSTYVYDTNSDITVDNIEAVAPENLLADGTLSLPNGGSISLNWTWAGDWNNWDKFIIYRSINSPGNWTNIDNITDSGIASYLDTGLDNYITYCYQIVTLMNDGDVSSPSNSACTDPNAMPIMDQVFITPNNPTILDAVKCVGYMHDNDTSTLYADYSITATRLSNESRSLSGRIQCLEIIPGQWPENPPPGLATHECIVPIPGVEKGDKYTCSMHPDDTNEYGGWVSSETVYINNSRPTATNVHIEPSGANVSSTLNCSYTFLDHDYGDSENVTETKFKWYKNIDGQNDWIEIEGQTEKTLKNTGTQTWFSKDDEIKCSVKVKDVDYTWPGFKNPLYDSQYRNSTIKTIQGNEEPGITNDWSDSNTTDNAVGIGELVNFSVKWFDKDDSQVRLSICKDFLEEEEQYTSGEDNVSFGNQSRIWFYSNRTGLIADTISIKPFDWEGSGSTTNHSYDIYAYEVDSIGSTSPGEYLANVTDAAFTIDSYNTFNLEYSAGAYPDKYIGFKICVDSDNDRTCDNGDVGVFVHANSTGDSSDYLAKEVDGTTRTLYNPEIKINYDTSQGGCDGTLYCNTSFSSNNPISCSYNTENITEGNYSYEIRVYDDQGASSEIRNNTFYVRNRGPSATDVSILPASPNESSTLNCTYNFTDPDGDSENVSAAIYTWYKNQDGLNSWIVLKNRTSERTLKNNATKKWFSKDDWIKCSVKVEDETGQTSDFSNSSYVTIAGNYPPTITNYTNNAGNTTPVILGNEVTFNTTWLDSDSQSFNLTICEEILTEEEQEASTTDTFLMFGGTAGWFYSNRTGVWAEKISIKISKFDEGGQTYTGSGNTTNNIYDIYVYSVSEKNDTTGTLITNESDISLTTGTYTNIKLGNAQPLTGNYLGFKICVDSNNDGTCDGTSSNWAYVPANISGDYLARNASGKNVYDPSIKINYQQVSGASCFGDVYCDESVDSTSDSTTHTCSYQTSSSESWENTHELMVCDSKGGCSNTYSSSFYVNRKPTIDYAYTEPTYPRDNESIVCNYSVSDPDGHTTSTTFKWYNRTDSSEWSEFGSTLDHINSGTTEPGEIWKCEVRVTDDYGASEKVNSTLAVVGGSEINGSSPTINSIITNTNSTPVNVGENVNFTVYWDMANKTKKEVVLFVCDSPEIDSSGCNDTQFASQGYGIYTSPIEVEYKTKSSDNTNQTYYAMICNEDMECSDLYNGSFYVNHQPSLTTNILPSSPTTISNLTCSYTYNSNDNNINDNESSLDFKWWVKNETEDSYNLLSGETGQNLTNPDYTKFNRDDTIKCSARVLDVQGLYSNWTNATKTINNAAPVYNQTIENQTQEEDNNITLDLSLYFIEPDGEDLVYYTSPNTSNITASLNNSLLDLVPDENWYGYTYANITVSDSELNTTVRVYLNLTSVNDAPIADNVTIVPSLPDSDQNLHCNYDYYDVEGDSENTTKRKYRWYVFRDSSRSLNSTSPNNTLPWIYTENNERWFCSVRTYDGKDVGAWSNSSDVSIGNHNFTIDEWSINSNTTDPVNYGDNIVFNASWEDPYENIDQVKLLVCNSTAVNNLGCFETTFCSAPLTSSSSTSCQVNSTSVLNNDNYYLFLYGYDSDLDNWESNLETGQFSINHRPFAYNVSITPQNANKNSVLVCDYEYNSSDTGISDSENTTAADFRWYVNGVMQTETNSSISGVFSTYDNVTCGVKVEDEQGFSDDVFVNSSRIAIQPYPNAPTLWEIPSVTNNEKIDVVGYLDNAFNVTVQDLNENNTPNIETTTNLKNTERLGESVAAEKGEEGNTYLKINIAEGFNKSTYLKIDSHDLQYYEYYNITNRTEIKINDTDVYRLSLDQPLKEDVPKATTVYGYNNSYPNGWFNVTMDLWNKTNQIGVWGTNSFGDGEMSSQTVYRDTQSPEFNLSEVNGTVRTVSDITFNVSDNYKLNLTTLSLNITNTSQNFQYLTQREGNITCSGTEGEVNCNATLTLDPNTYNLTFYVQDLVGLEKEETTEYKVEGKPTAENITIVPQNANKDSVLNCTYDYVNSTLGFYGPENKSLAQFKWYVDGEDIGIDSKTLDYAFSLGDEVKCSVKVSDVNGVQDTKFRNSTSIKIRDVPKSPSVWKFPEVTGKDEIDVIGYGEGDGILNVTVEAMDVNNSIKRAVTEDLKITKQVGESSTVRFVEKGKKYIKINSSTDEGFNKSSYLKITGQNRENFLYYNITGKNHSETEGLYILKLQQNLLENVTVGTKVYAYNDTYPNNWFNITSELWEGSNDIGVVSENPIGRGEVYWDEIYYDAEAPVFNLTQIPEGSTSSVSDIDFKIKDDYEIDFNTTELNITNSSGTVLYYNQENITCNGTSKEVDCNLTFDLERGSYNLTFSANDTVGNSNSTTKQFVVDKTKDSAPEVQREAEMVYDRTLFMSWTPTNIYSLQYTVGRNTYPETGWDSVLQWTNATDSEISQGNLTTPLLKLVDDEVYYFNVRYKKYEWSDWSYIGSSGSMKYIKEQEPAELPTPVEVEAPRELHTTQIIEANWTESQASSGYYIVRYDYAVGTAKYPDSGWNNTTSGWVDNGLDRDIFREFNLTNRETYYVNVRAVDSGGFESNVSSSGPITYYNQESPTARIMSVENDTYMYDGWLDDINNSYTNITVHGNRNITCYYSLYDRRFIDMVNNSDPRCDASGTWGENLTCQIPNLEEESYTYYIACKDSDGRMQDNYENTRVDFDVDYSGPNITFIYPEERNFTAQKGKFGKEDKFLFNMSDVPGGVYFVNYTIMNSTGDLMETGDFYPYSSTYYYKSLTWYNENFTDGNYSILVKARDYYDHYNNYTRNFTLDKTAPNITLDSSVNNSYFHDNFNSTVRIQDYVNASYNVIGTTLRETNNSTGYWNDVNWTSLINITELEDGEYSIIYWARDSVNNTNTNEIENAHFYNESDLSEVGFNPDDFEKGHRVSWSYSLGIYYDVYYYQNSSQYQITPGIYTIITEKSDYADSIYESDKDYYEDPDSYKTLGENEYGEKSLRVKYKYGDKRVLLIKAGKLVLMYSYHKEQFDKIEELAEMGLKRIYPNYMNFWVDKHAWFNESNPISNITWMEDINKTNEIDLDQHFENVSGVNISYSFDGNENITIDIAEKFEVGLSSWSHGTQEGSGTVTEDISGTTVILENANTTFHQNVSVNSSTQYELLLEHKANNTEDYKYKIKIEEFNSSNNLIKTNTKNFSASISWKEIGYNFSTTNETNKIRIKLEQNYLKEDKTTKSEWRNIKLYEYYEHPHLVSLMPKKDWSGVEPITFYANDSYGVRQPSNVVKLNVTEDYCDPPDSGIWEVNQSEVAQCRIYDQEELNELSGIEAVSNSNLNLVSLDLNYPITFKDNSRGYSEDSIFRETVYLRNNSFLNATNTTFDTVVVEDNATLQVSDSPGTIKILNVNGNQNLELTNTTIGDAFFRRTRGELTNSTMNSSTFYINGTGDVVEMTEGTNNGYINTTDMDLNFTNVEITNITINSEVGAVLNITNSSFGLLDNQGNINLEGSGIETLTIRGNSITNSTNSSVNTLDPNIGTGRIGTINGNITINSTNSFTTGKVVRNYPIYLYNGVGTLLQNINITPSSQSDLAQGNFTSSTSRITLWTDGLNLRNLTLIDDTPLNITNWWLDPDGDGTSISNDLDDDNDGINDPDDFLTGDVSWVGTNTQDLNMTVNGTYNLTREFNGTLPVNISDSEGTIASFGWNFSENRLGLQYMNITKGRTSDRREYLVVSGLELPGETTKTLYLNRTNSTNLICIKDKSSLTVSEVSTDSTCSEGVFVECPKNGTYNCSLINGNNTFKITGLRNTGLLQLSETPTTTTTTATTTTVSGGNGGGGGISLGPVGLEVNVTDERVEINNLNIGTDEIKTMNIDDWNGRVWKIRIHASERISAGYIHMERIGPWGIWEAPSLGEDVYHYFRIDTNLENKTKEIEFYFSVEKKWLEDNSLDKASLWRYRGGWNKLETEKINETGSLVDYKSIFSHFSHFAVRGETTGPISPGTTTTIKEVVCGNNICESGETEKTCPEDCKKREIPGVLYVIIPAIFLVFVILLGVKKKMSEAPKARKPMRREVKRKPKPPPPPTTSVKEILSNPTEYLGKKINLEADLDFVEFEPEENKVLYRISDDTGTMEGFSRNTNYRGHTRVQGTVKRKGDRIYLYF